MTCSQGTVRTVRQFSSHSTYFLLVPRTKLEGVLDALLVLPVPDVDEAEEVLVAVPEVPLHTRRPRPRHGARAASIT